MRRASYIGVLATIGAAAMVLAGASAAAGPPMGLSAAKGQIRTAGIAVVRQVGLRNYAGPNCPGKGWRCTTSTNVVQVATGAGAVNKAECTPSLGGGTVGSGGATQMCDIVQSGSSNNARCVQSSTMAGAVQSCVILQTGADNKAYVKQSVQQKDGSTQSASQSASVTQLGAVSDTNAKNDSKISQSARQTSRTGATQIQNAYQSSIVEQTAKGSGKNDSAIAQSQAQKAYNGTTQSQNSAGSLPFADCAGSTPSAPNACANVMQHSIGGKNSSDLKQTIKESAQSKFVANQDQGSYSGGLEGQVHQDTVTGSSSDKAKQRKDLNAKAADSSSQTQIDPVRCCGTASQVGGSGNQEDIDQSSKLTAKGDSDPNQSVDLRGESVTPTGSCTVSQHASINGASTPNSASFNPCPLLILETSCQGGFEGDSTCTAFPPYVGCGIDCIGRLPGVFFALPRG